MKIDLVVTADRSLARPWALDALCREPEYRRLPWFAESAGAVEVCAAVCARCLVADECQSFADRVDARYGTWAGVARGLVRRVAR